MKNQIIIKFQLLLGKYAEKVRKAESARQHRDCFTDEEFAKYLQDEEDIKGELLQFSIIMASSKFR